MLIKTLPGEVFWGGRVADGIHMPYQAGFTVDLRDTQSNQVNWTLISNLGRVIWANQSFRFTILPEGVDIECAGKINQHQAGNSLKDAFLFSQKKLYPPHEAVPPRVLFDIPQFNTWIELIYNQNQEDILKYGENIIQQGYPAGVLMIDDNWQEDYGVWRFFKGRFPDPKAMTDKLHSLGFKIMLWIAPFVSPDCATFRDLRNRDFLVKNKEGFPHLAEWWNGYSAVLDLSNPEAWKWFKNELVSLMDKYGIDGFKMDAGGPQFYPEDGIYHVPGAGSDKQTQLFSEFSAQFELNELRETINQPYLPCAQRLSDKNHRWVNNGIDTLIPNSLAQSMMGYSYICPDMIGGGEYSVFMDGNPNLDQELVVRYAQSSALMPMMQFSMAPWRVLSPENSRYCHDAAMLHVKMSDVIWEYAQKVKNGEPIIRPMEYMYPHSGFENMRSQFFLGEDILVAPVTVKGETERKVYLPEGKWEADDGLLYDGGCEVLIKAPLGRLPWFKRLKL